MNTNGPNLPVEGSKPFPYAWGGDGTQRDCSGQAKKIAENPEAFLDWNPHRTSGAAKSAIRRLFSRK